MLGPHGYGKVNDVGKEMLFFFVTLSGCCVIQKDVYKQTWQHPKPKEMELY